MIVVGLITEPRLRRRSCSALELAIGDRLAVAQLARLGAAHGRRSPSGRRRRPPDPRRRQRDRRRPGAARGAPAPLPGAPSEIFVVVPGAAPRGSSTSPTTSTGRSPRRASGSRARSRRCRDAGLSARGQVGDHHDPNAAIEDALREFAADEVVISTHPPERSKWLERGVVERAAARGAAAGHARDRRPRGRGRGAPRAGLAARPGRYLPVLSSR